LGSLIFNFDINQEKPSSGELQIGGSYVMVALVSRKPIQLVMFV